MYIRAFILPDVIENNNDEIVFSVNPDEDCIYIIQIQTCLNAIIYLVISPHIIEVVKPCLLIPYKQRGCGQIATSHLIR